MKIYCFIDFDGEQGWTNYITEEKLIQEQYNKWRTAMGMRGVKHYTDFSIKNFIDEFKVINYAWEVDLPLNHLTETQYKELTSFGKFSLLTETES